MGIAALRPPVGRGYRRPSRAREISLQRLAEAKGVKLKKHGENRVLPAGVRQPDRIHDGGGP